MPLKIVIVLDTGVSAGGRAYARCDGDNHYPPDPMTAEAQLAWVAGFLAGATSYQLAHGNRVLEIQERQDSHAHN